MGGQPTKGDSLSFSKIAKAFGYQFCFKVDNLDQIGLIFKENLKRKGSLFIEVLCRPGFRSNLGRPKNTPEENKNAFINFLK